MCARRDKTPPEARQRHGQHEQRREQHDERRRRHGRRDAAGRSIVRPRSPSPAYAAPFGHLHRSLIRRRSASRRPGAHHDRSESRRHATTSSDGRREKRPATEERRSNDRRLRFDRERFERDGKSAAARRAGTQSRRRRATGYCVYIFLPFPFSPPLRPFVSQSPIHHTQATVWCRRARVVTCFRCRRD